MTEDIPIACFCDCVEPDPEVLAAAHAAAEALIRTARVLLDGGSLPPIGSKAWITAPWPVQAATLTILGAAYLWRSPDRIAADQLKAVSVAISTGMDWSRAAHPLVYETPGVLAARRAIPVTPVQCQHQGCRAVVSVEHPLPPDLRTVRCGNHRKPAIA